MSDEIYYTSAPQGLRPGQRGFCTVATSAQISRPLWDRLESVSGYRHHFTSADGPSRNPTAWGHWLIQIQGREISVLSRVCDSGLDYTQRTNAFAHHLALEPTERAAGGPAWMLSQPGVMSTQWDGNVGAINRSQPLPAGQVLAAPCSAWGRLAGDAGWAGVLAEAGMKQPRRPVCMIFAPEQEMLPLIAEAIALLPESRRWEISFNTYFTGLPSNAMCAWRCCLAGTPAAAEAARHAKGGLVIDLSHPERLGKVPPGQWVDSARSGLAASDLSPARPNWMRIRPAPAAFGDVKLSNDSALDDPVQSDAPIDVDVDAPALPPAAKLAGTFRGLDLSWIDQRRRARRRMLLCFVGLALLFIGGGIWFRIMERRATDEQPSSSPGQPAPPEQPSVRETQRVPGPADSPVIHPVPAPVAIPEPIHAPVATSPTVEARIPQVPAPATVPVAVPAPPVPAPLPSAIHLSSDLAAPVPSVAAMRDPVQGIAIPVGQFDDLIGVRSFQVVLPGKGRSYPVSQPKLSGTLSVEASPREKLMDIVIWRDAANRATPIEVATVALEPYRQGTPEGRIDIAWRTGVLVKRPEVASLARSVLQHAELIVADAGRLRPQTITFKEPAPIVIDIGRPTSTLAAPSLPDGVSLREDGKLPDGWRMTWKRETEQKSSPSGEVGVLSFERPVSGNFVCRFALRFAPGWASVSSNWSEQRKALRSSLSHMEADVDRADEEIGRLQQARQAALAPLEKELAEAHAMRRLTDAELREHSMNREMVKQRIEQALHNLAAVRPRVDTPVQEARARREAAESSRAAAGAAAAALEHFADADIVVEMTDKLRVATLRLKLTMP